MAQDDDRDSGVALPIVWVDLDDADIRYVNQILVQQHEGEFIITLGHLAPPPLLGTPDENEALAKQIPYVPVKVVARVGMTSTRVEQFIELMQRVLKAYQDQRGKQAADQ